jgi:ribosomal protein S18 acetylase RimI-like enzyme
MPVVADPARANGRLLLDAAGDLIGSFELGERDGRPLADIFAPADGIPPDRAARAVMAEMKGWRVAGEEPFSRLLVAAGARPLRHAHVMSRDLTRNPAPGDWLEPSLPAGVRITPVDRPAIDLAPAFRAAFPSSHPDYGDIRDPDHPEEELEELISGRLLGPLLRCSGLAIADGGEVVGAILVNGKPGEPPFDGPWIAEVFRRPDAPGIGGALLKRALAIATRDRLPAMGLAVTHTNPAIALYAALGFAGLLDVLNVEI